MTCIRRFAATLIGSAQIALAATAAAQSLSLDDALRAADAQSPRLSAQRALVRSADHQAARAGELPDPKLRFSIENLPVTGDDAFRYDKDFMTMPSIGPAQDFPNRTKREARSTRAERARDVEQAQFASQAAMLHREVALAWFEVHFAERAREALNALVRQFAAHADTVTAGLARGKQGAADSFMLRGSLEQVRDRVIEQERMAARSRAMLEAF